MNLFEYIYPRFYFDKTKPIRLFEAFSGIGCQAMALKRITSNYELVGFSEIDKPAIQSYKAIHGEVRNYGDITKMEKIPECDIFTYSFPCQDLSLAGKQKGLGQGTRSGLVYEVLRLLHNTEKKPKVLIMENVSALISATFVNQFNEIQLELEQLGYKNYNEVLNAKDYGIPQNRERIFMVSILGDYSYTFPEPIKLELRLKDMLEDEVDEKYYLSKKALNGLKNLVFENSKSENEIELKQVAQLDGFESSGRIYDENGLAPTINTMGGGQREPKVMIEPICLNSKVNGKQPSLQNRIYDSESISTAITTSFLPSILIPEATEKGYAEAHGGDGVYLNRPHQKRGVVQKGMIQTLKTSGDDIGVVVAAEIRTDEGIRTFGDNNMEALRTTGSCGDKVVIELSSKNKRLKSVVENNEFSKDDTKNIDIFNQKISDISQTITLPNHNSQALFHNLRIRKLTPKECWRLMGISDDDFNKAKASGMSNSQLYKQAGNGIVVNVFEAILRELIK